MAPSRKAKQVSIGDVPAAPADPDAPRDIPSGKQVVDIAQWTDHCSLTVGREILTRQTRFYLLKNRQQSSCA